MCANTIINNNRWIVQIWLRQHIQVCRLNDQVYRISFATFCSYLSCQQLLKHDGVRSFAVLANQVALPVIDIIDAGQDERGDAAGHKVAEALGIDVRFQLLAIF